MPTPSLADITRTLVRDLSPLRFSPPVTHVYNPLDYAWEPHLQYLTRFGHSPKRIILLGMNPGPFGMAQTGVPFGEVTAVRDWMGIHAPVRKPAVEHPKRPVQGFDCPKSEVSGRRLWGLFSQRFPDAQTFFADHFVLNYCPLVFMSATGANITPDKLPTHERSSLDTACDAHLAASLQLLRPNWVVGVGAFAEAKARQALDTLGGTAFQVGKVLHPSPASPAANRGWAQAASQQLTAQGIWPS